MQRTQRITGAGLLALALFAMPFVHQVQVQPTAPAAAVHRPNIVFILIDDMRWDIMSCADHPFVRTPNLDRIAAAGTRFTNAFVTTSLCSPARASFLTGTYAHLHNVRNNEKDELGTALPTFPGLLQQAGYETAYVGKWHMSGDPNPRPGFDYWLSFRGQGRYLNPELNENGRSFQATGYMTDLLTRYAVDYLKRPHAKPFLLCLSHKAMHADFTPAERHTDLYRSVDLPEPPSFSETLAGKPRWKRECLIRGGRFNKPSPPDGIPDEMPPVTWNTGEGRLNYLRTLAAVDDSVQAVLDTLRETGIADRTIVIFTSDNGFFLGEHRRGDKRLAYEESIRIPLLVSGPGLSGPRVAPEMVLNIDLAPTILDLAGVQPPASMQGRSLKPILRGERPPWRNSFLYQYFKEDWLPGVPTMLAVRTADWKYVRYPEIDDLDELYDLKADPHEMRNLAQSPAAAERRHQLRAELDRLLTQTRYTEHRDTADPRR